jgi:hypothetical protein
MGDASVRFVKETVSSWPIDLAALTPVGALQVSNGFVNVPRPGVWQALTTRAGNETISE